MKKLFLFVLMIALSASVYSEEQVPVQPVKVTLDSQKEALMNKLAIDRVAGEMLPLSDEEAKYLKMLLQKTEKIKEEPFLAPMPLSRSIIVDTKPGSMPQTIYLSPGYVSTLTMLDKGGETWPISRAIIGNPDKFTLDVVQDTSMAISPTTKYGQGNVLVFLKDVTSPIMLTLKIGVDKVDYSAEVRLMKNGPNAKSPILSTSFSGNNQLNSLSKFTDNEILSLLDGVKPDGYVALTTDYNNADLWSKGKMLYVRTKSEIISPAWLNKVTSVDGTNLYTIPSISRILFMDSGIIEEAKVKVETGEF